MKPGKLMLLIAAAIFVVAAAPPLFKVPTESRWTVTSGDKPVATVIVLTDGKSVRAEWKPVAPGATVVFLGGSEKLWVRGSGGDVEFARYKGGLESTIVPALTLPFTTAANAKVEEKAGKLSAYSFGTSKAAYTYDASGPSAVSVTAGGKTYAVARSMVGKPAVSDASLYVVRPRKTAVSQISQAAGNIFGGPDSSVSATAGARGVGRGKAFADGGDYAALEQLETRVDQNKEKIESALTSFQKEGKVGESQEN